MDLPVGCYLLYYIRVSCAPTTLVAMGLPLPQNGYEQSCRLERSPTTPLVFPRSSYARIWRNRVSFTHLVDSKGSKENHVVEVDISINCLFQLHTPCEASPERQ